jgi:hypothetical protein
LAEKTEEDLLIREIEDDLRQDRMKKLWAAYGQYALAAVIALVVGIAGHEGWQAWDKKSRAAAGERFQAAIALSQSEKTDEALKNLQSMAADARAGYAMLARFHGARIMAEKGDAAEAAKAYRALADDAGIDQIYRDLAVILGAAQELSVPGADLKALDARLKPLAADAGLWRSSARELSALIALAAGDKAAAEKIFVALADDRQAVPGVRERAREMASVLRQ